MEAHSNLERKRPDRLEALSRVLEAVELAAEPSDGELAWSAELVHPDDVHVLASARAAGADVLVTGDTRHFGHVMGREDLGLLVRTPRRFLLEGPSPADAS